MSTSGKYGERQSWRRAESGQAGKRKTIKALLTLVAIVLTLLFVYMLLPGPNRQLITILVSNDYDTDVITPPMFGANARAALKSQLQANDLRGSCDVIRSSFQQTELVSKYLSDPDDTVMVVLRGYLMLDGEDRPSLACSDLAIGSSPQSPNGLLPLTEILEPLAAVASSSFRGTRLVVIDAEPLAAQPSLGQWNDDVFAKLDETIRQLPGQSADRLWVLLTRGPMQNAGWDATTQMPLSTQTLLDGIQGGADLNRDLKIELDELCAFLSDRYGQMPRNNETDSPRVMLLRGGVGQVESNALSRGDLDVWVARVEPPADEEGEAETPEDSGAVADDLADKLSQSRPTSAPITPVVLQSAGGEAAKATPPEGSAGDAAGQTTDAPTADAGAPAAPTATAAPSPTGTAADAPAASNAPGGLVDAPAELTFWDIRDQFESIPLASSDGKPDASPIALAPHLWRRLLVLVLAGQIKDFDPASPTPTPRQVAEDLRELQRVIKGQTPSGEINDNISDDIVSRLKRLVLDHRVTRESTRPDRRLRAADALQHAVAVARSRLWSWLEFQCQAAIAGGPVPDQGIADAALQAERVLAAGEGSERPDQGTLDRQLSRLHAAINVFDRNVEGAVNQLLAGFALDDPPRTWELNRNAWAWLRSPLPTGDQRRRLRAAITNARIDPTDTQERAVNFSDVVFARPTPSQRSRDVTMKYRSELAEYEKTRDVTAGPVDKAGPAGWKAILQQGKDQPGAFADRFAAALRIDPRINVVSNQQPISHAITPKPIVRIASVTILDDSGQKLGDSAVLRLETMQDRRNVTLRIDPGRDRPVRLLVSASLRSSSNDFGPPRAEVVWKAPGMANSRPGESIAITIDGDSSRDLPLEIRPATLAERGVDLKLQLQIRADRVSDEIEGVVGIHSLPIELPRENRLRLVASSPPGIGCSREVLSDDGSLPGGLWLRTFNRRKTPFRFELFNESGKACMAKVWLIKLPKPMPDTVAAYWPDFAANLYASPEGGILDEKGRILEKFLLPTQILKGPSTLAIPADGERVALNFQAPAASTDGASAPAAASVPATPAAPGDTQTDVSHGMALVCRLVDADDNVMPEKDQIICLVAKPWAPSDYVTTNVSYNDGEVEVNVELEFDIDGDASRDALPQLEKVPVNVRWVQDDQWSDFTAETSDPPRSLFVDLNPQAGRKQAFFRVPVVRRNRESWCRLDVDGWPRAIQHVVQHQPGALGAAKLKNQIKFGSIALTRRPQGNTEQPTTSYHWPENDVYFKGDGDQLIATIKADFGFLTRTSDPEVALDVEGRRFTSYKTDRFIRTTASPLSDQGVITLTTQVSDIQVELSQGRYRDERIPIDATLKLDNIEQENASITAVLDSTPPDKNLIAITPRQRGPYYDGSTLEFSVTASDLGSKAAGISRLEIGLDTTQDGKANTKQDDHVFDPPVSPAVLPAGKSRFKFQVAGEYAVIVRAIDAAGNESSNRYPITITKKPPPADTPGGEGTGTPKVKMGWLHGVLDTRAGMNGTLFLSPAPAPVNSKEKTILGQDKRFDFGPLPEGKYSLKFKGTKQNTSVTLTWKDLEIDTTPKKSKPLSLSLDQAETE
ncbi:hypothetical protein Enr13x_55040 [Stieleria neptunia]|uniref:Uncharacterized protein n=1 Tax=Stieleria neptunia TaxID=2527979 RepID=A0A518HXN8_9BACT|nr:hypothetical protein [Stieleria neptunia]QDV45625.1 hypothetical protein Enr13x_55040 [Stieleria neptunia]